MNTFTKSFRIAVIITLAHQITLTIYQYRAPIQSASSFNQENKVVIGSVYCRPKKIPILKDKYFGETITMLKSALISAHLYNISTLEIHLFLEHSKDESYFKTEVLEKMKTPGVNVNLQVHSALDKVPKKHEKHMVYHPRYRCGYVRLYLPEVLTDVDSIVYLDSDIVVTGDLKEHWKLLSNMDLYQMISAGRDSPHENKKYLKNYINFFSGSPNVPPRGINSGLLVMNLTRMREFKMVDKLTRAYEDYLKVANFLTNQKVLNILLYFNPGLLLSMPCNLHFMGPDCEDDGFYCQPALDDPDGVHAVHGTDHRFIDDGVFNPIYTYYKKFDVSKILEADTVTDLMKPLKSFYSIRSEENLKNNCTGRLGNVLFKRFLN